MRCRMSAKLVEVVRLNGSRAGCHDRFSSRRPVGGEVFYLDSPFIEPTIRPLITDGPAENLVCPAFTYSSLYIVLNSPAHPVAVYRAGNQLSCLKNECV